jgi:hypothetical protein
LILVTLIIEAVLGVNRRLQSEELLGPWAPSVRCIEEEFTRIGDVTVIIGTGVQMGPYRSHFSNSTPLGPRRGLDIFLTKVSQLSVSQII